MDAVYKLAGRGAGEGAAPSPQCKPSTDSIWGNRVAWFGLLGLLLACLFDGWMVCR